MRRLEFKRSHKAKGLCYDCSEPVYRGGTRCFKHTLSHRDAQHKYYVKHRELYAGYYKKLKERRVEKNRCYACGGPMDSDKLVTCVNCREHIYGAR